MNRKLNLVKILKKYLTLALIIYGINWFLLNFFIFKIDKFFLSVNILILIPAFLYGRIFFKTKIVKQKTQKWKMFLLYLPHIISIILLIFWLFFHNKFIAQCVLSFYLFYLLGGLSVVIKNNIFEVDKI
jgi:hypothetical protein